MRSLTDTRYIKRTPNGKPIRTCDRCGGVFPYEAIRQEWTGLFVCDGPNTHGCFEDMHPSLRFSGPTDGSLSLPEPRPPRDGHGADVPENTAASTPPDSYANNLLIIKQRGLPS